MNTERQFHLGKKGIVALALSFTLIAGVPAGGFSYEAHQLRIEQQKLRESLQ